MKKWKCTICNYIHEGEEPPDECPVCGADKSVFIQIDEEDREISESSGESPSVKDSDGQDKEGIEKVRRWKCTICNYIHEGPEPPDECPVCGADSSAFVEIDGEEVEIEQQEIKATEAPVPESAVEESATQEPATTDGETVKDEVQQSRPFGLLGRLVMKLHLHAISVHTPNGVIPVAMVFLVLAVFFKLNLLEPASFFNLIFVLLSMPVVVFTGIISWKVKYRGAKTWVFRTKLTCSVIVAVLLTIMVIWRFTDPGIATAGDIPSWIYLGIGGALLAAAGIAGHLGGKLVHGS